MLAHAGLPALARQRPEQGGDPGLLPGRRHGAAAAPAASQAGAAGAPQGAVVALLLGAAGGGEPAVALLRREEAAVVGGAGRAEGTRRAGVSEHAGVVGHGAPEAAVAGDAEAVAAHRGAERGVGGVAGADVVEFSWGRQEEVDLLVAVETGVFFRRLKVKSW